MFSLTQPRKPEASRSLKAGAVAFITAAVATFALSLPASAQDAATPTGIDLWNNGGCFGCHGDLAAGGGDSANVGAPSLRRRLKHDVIVDAIACGRAGGMPAFLNGAYTETACGDAPVGEVPSNIIAMDSFSAEEIDTLVAWLEENVVGKNKITRENCALFFDGNADAPTCMQY